MLITLFLTVMVAILAIVISSSQSGFGIFAPPEIAGSRDVFPSAKVVNLTGASGPESLAFDPAGEGPYVGVADGRVLKWRGESLGWTNFTHTSTNRYIFKEKIEHLDRLILNLALENLWFLVFS